MSTHTQMPTHTVPTHTRTPMPTHTIPTHRPMPHTPIPMPINLCTPPRTAHHPYTLIHRTHSRPLTHQQPTHRAPHQTRTSTQIATLGCLYTLMKNTICILIIKKPDRSSDNHVNLFVIIYLIIKVKML